MTKYTIVKEDIKIDKESETFLLEKLAFHPLIPDMRNVAIVCIASVNTDQCKCKCAVV